MLKAVTWFSIVFAVVYVYGKWLDTQAPGDGLATFDQTEVFCIWAVMSLCFMAGAWTKLPPVWKKLF